MAYQNFDVQIQNLLAIDSTTLASIQGLLDTWMTNGAKEITNLMPRDMLNSVATETSAFDPDSGTTLTTFKILKVYRNDGTIDQPCRRIPAALRGRATDRDDMNYATATDPVYYTEPQTDGTMKVIILPVSSSSVGKVVYASPPTVDASSGGSIAGFPDEAEYLVMLYGAVKAGEYLLANNEDIELLSPIIANLKNDYQMGLAALYGQQGGARA